MKSWNKYAYLLCILTLLGCMDKEKALEGKLIEPHSLIDQKKFVKESKERTDNVLEFGPNVVEVDQIGLRDERAVINREDAPNYDSLQDDGTGKVFPIDLNVENIDIRTFTQMLSQITGINFLVADEVSGMVTAKLQDVSWPNALDSVLSLKNLAKHVDNKANIIRIHSQTAIVALESFERQRKTDLQQTAMLERLTEPLFTEVFKLYYTNPDDVQGVLTSVLGIKESAGEGRNTQAQITVDKRMNQLIVKARKEDLDTIQSVIKKVDTRTKQIFIEAFIVEVTDDFEKALGTQIATDLAAAKEKSESGNDSGKTWNSRLYGSASTPGGVTAEDTTSSLFNFAVPGATSGIGLLAGLGDAADLKLALSALEIKEISKVISNPRIFTLDNQEATIFQGTEVPYETTSADGTSVQFISAGLNLAVTPTVIGDGNLMMNISLNKDTPDLSKDIPPITSSSIKTKLVTKDGSIVVIGGIYTQTKSDGESKVPFFGDIPAAGKLFRRDTREDNKQELMIFIAPRII